MNTHDLIKLARKADLEGDIELADYLDNQLIRVSQLKNFFQKGLDTVGDFFKNQRMRDYNVDFKNVADDASNLGMIAGHPTQRGNAVQKFFQAGLKDKVRTPERLDQIGEQIKGSIGKVISNDPNVHLAVTKYNAGKFTEITPAERNALLNHLVNNDKISTRANDISPDDIIKVLSGQKPSAATKQVTTLSKAGITGNTAAILGTGAAGLGVYNATKQQASPQPGSLSNPSGGPFQSMPEMGGGGGMPSMSEVPSMGGGGQGGYQGPTYNMPSANQSFQPMQGYQPANQVRELPRTNDMAEPLYPRITPQQAMQNAMYVDKARRFDELNANANRPAAEPIIGPGTPTTPDSPTSKEFNFAKEYGLRPATLEEAKKYPLPGLPQTEQSADTQEAAPTPAVQGVGQAVDLSNPTGFNPQNPFNI
jgi:hypothetical protein